MVPLAQTIDVNMPVSVAFQSRLHISMTSLPPKHHITSGPDMPREYRDFPFPVRSARFRRSMHAFQCTPGREPPRTLPLQPICSLATIAAAVRLIDSPATGS